MENTKDKTMLHEYYDKWLQVISYYYNNMICKYIGIQSVQMLTGSQLSGLQKAGRTEGGPVPQLNALHYATIANI